MKRADLSVEVTDAMLDYQVMRPASDPILSREKSIGHRSPSPLDGDVSPITRTTRPGIERPDSLVWALNEHNNMHKPHKPGPYDFHLPKKQLADFQLAQPPVTSLAPKTPGRLPRTPYPQASTSKFDGHATSDGPWEDVSLFESGPRHKPAVPRYKPAEPLQQPSKVVFPTRSHEKTHDDGFRQGGRTEKGLRPFKCSTGAIMISSPPKKPQRWVIFLVAIIIVILFGVMLAGIIVAKR